MYCRMLVLTALLMTCGMTRAEWYRIDAVPAYNTVRASVVDGSGETITIRIRNLEKIEYIQPDPEKVLLGGQETKVLTLRVLLGQIVWVENLKAEEGAYVGDLYPSFEQVVTAFRDSRIINGGNVTPETANRLKLAYRNMLRDMNLSPLILESDQQAGKTAEDVRQKTLSIYQGIISDIRMGTPKNMSSTANYEDDFQRTLITADALIWFRQNGQFMHPAAQKLFIDLLQSFQNDSSQEAYYTQVKLQQIQEKHTVFNELFLHQSEFNRGQFAYTCLDWFKNRGQYLPAEVQGVFINWLTTYQRTNMSDGKFMKERLQWMMDNNGLYQDFLIANP